MCMAAPPNSYLVRSVNGTDVEKTCSESRLTKGFFVAFFITIILEREREPGRKAEGEREIPKQGSTLNMEHRDGSHDPRIMT